MIRDPLAVQSGTASSATANGRLTHWQSDCQCHAVLAVMRMSKILEIDKGKRCSLHFHKIKSESFYLRAGRLKVRVKESPESETIEEFVLEAGQCMDIPIGLVHQMEALENAELYEFSTQHFDSDSHRLVRGD